MKKKKQEREEASAFLDAIFSMAKAVDDELLKRNGGDQDKAMDEFCRIAFGELRPISELED